MHYWPSDCDWRQFCQHGSRIVAHSSTIQTIGHPERGRSAATDESKDLHLALRADQLLLCVPLFTQIDPSRIALLDECDLLRSSPSLQLLLPLNRAAGMSITLKPYQAVAVVLRRKTLKELVLVLEDSFVEIARHPDVKSKAPTGYDVGVIEALVHSGRPKTIVGRVVRIIEANAGPSTRSPRRPRSG